MITQAEYLMGRDKEYPLSSEQLDNSCEIVELVNELLSEFGQDRRVTSGYRPAAINSKVPNAAVKSKHITCQACDLEDVDGKLDEWCRNNLAKLAEIGLWLESPTSTPTWCHVQSVPPKSGNRIFFP